MEGNEKIISGILLGCEALRFTTEYVDEEDGSVSGWVHELKACANAKDKASCCLELVECLRTVAGVRLEQMADWVNDNPELVGYVLKVISSTDDELRVAIGGEGLTFPEGYEPQEYGIWSKNDGKGFRFAPFPEIADDDDSDIPAKLWEYMKDQVFMLSEADIAEIDGE